MNQGAMMGDASQQEPAAAQHNRDAEMGILFPESRAYHACLSGLHNGIAAAQEPSLIVQPRSEQDVIDAIQLANERGLAISVCSGSHSAWCSRTGTLMLDLGHSMNRIMVRGDQVMVQAGASMGGLLHELAQSNRMVPVGTHPTPGSGLLTMGGIGHLSRSLGLTLDHVVELKGVTATGEAFVITADHPDKELWAMLRGAAIFLAVITEATLRTEIRHRLNVVRFLSALDDLLPLLCAAEALPDQASCSLILGFPPDQEQPQILGFAVAAQQHADWITSFHRPERSWLAVVDGLELLPDFDLPLLDGTVPQPPPISQDRCHRLRSKVYSISLPRGLAASLTSVLIAALASAPNRDCRIDLQHVGGVVNQIPIDASTYRGRQAEWSIVITAIWPAGAQSIQAEAVHWADRCFDALQPLANHYYLVQRHPGSSRFASELTLAYGSMLEPLRKRKRDLDPDGLLPTLA